jgi:hypothetical protein
MIRCGVMLASTMDLQLQWFVFPDHGTDLYPPRLPIFFYTLYIPKTHSNLQPDRMETLSATFSADAYFETQPPPSTIEQDVQSVHEFLKQQRKQGRKVVLVTVSTSA